MLAFHCPRWSELPDLDLYMDQVVTFLEQSLSVFSEGEKPITATMINNYVKQHFIPKPEKKRYHREHIACLMVYALFKQVLPLTDIQKGVYLQLELCDHDFQKAYDRFCEQIELSLAYVADAAQGKAVEQTTFAEMPLTILGTSMAALSLASKILAQKVLALNNYDDVTDYGVEGSADVQK